MTKQKKKEEIAIKIDEERIKKVCKAYFIWKELNNCLKDMNCRGVNMLEAISEPMGCYCLGYLWNRDASGDATNPKTGEKIEFKSTSNYDDDLSSFGPKCYFDNLIFLRFKIEEDLLFVYDLQVNYDEFGHYPVNKKEKVHDHRQQGKRPRLSLIKTIIEPNLLKPDYVFDIQACKVYDKSECEQFL